MARSKMILPPTITHHVNDEWRQKTLNHSPITWHIECFLILERKRLKCKARFFRQRYFTLWELWWGEICLHFKLSSCSFLPSRTLFWFDLIVLNKWITVENPSLCTPYVWLFRSRSQKFYLKFNIALWNKREVIKS